MRGGAKAPPLFVKERPGRVGSFASPQRCSFGRLRTGSFPKGEKRADSTVLTIVEVSGGEGDARQIRVVNHYSWTGLPFTLLLNKITDIAKGWGLRRLAADATGLGAPLCAALKQAIGHRIVSFVFTTASKSGLGYELLAAAGTGRLQLYARDASAECDECWQELENAAADYKPNRALNFYVDPSKDHDDYLMSLALTVEALTGMNHGRRWGGWGE